ncbi:MAG: LysM peptidoglycan-binding domain-containing protein [Kiritimatiellae bacterium]|nr:LysM peptidoglycan-binding domain-containing protein [Kiritimatiellia bacterium]
MKQFGMVLGAAAIAALAGCKDPNYRRGGAPAGQNEVKSADTTTTVVQPAPQQVQQCKCAPGTRHTAPCACGGANCYCIVEQKIATPTPAQPVVVQPPPRIEPPKVEPETTIYVVQSGDYLAKISKKFNVTIAAIKRVNGLTSDVVRVGQKLKIPGKFGVGAKAEPAKAAATAAPKKSSAAAAPYTGATKEYVVKSGDTLGAIAYGNGITIRQLKELNGLTNDVVRVGQKLKIPAEKQAKAATWKSRNEKQTKTVSAKPAAPTQEKKSDVAAAPAAPVAAPAEEKPAEDANATAPAAETAPAETAAAAPAAPATIEYIVQEGDDMTGVSIRFGVSAAEIRELNNLGESDQLKPGQVIKLPAEAQQ